MELYLVWLYLTLGVDIEGRLHADFLISVLPRRKKLGLCPFIDLMHQTLQTGPNRDNIVNLG